MEKKKVYVPVDIKVELPPKEKDYPHMSIDVIVIDIDTENKQYSSSYQFDLNFWMDFDSEIVVTHWLKEQELYVFTKEELESLLRFAFNEGDNAEPGTAGWLQRAEDAFIASLNLK